MPVGAGIGVSVPGGTGVSEGVSGGVGVGVGVGGTNVFSIRIAKPSAVASTGFTGLTLAVKSSSSFSVTLYSTGRPSMVTGKSVKVVCHCPFSSGLTFTGIPTGTVVPSSKNFAVS